jgi:hypothetical protein
MGHDNVTAMMIIITDIISEFEYIPHALYR